MATRIKEKYLAEAVPALQQKFGYKNVMEIPRLEKIVINMGLGDCKDNAKAMEMAVNELTTIAGQKPMVTKAKKSIANFKVREGMNVGAKVTLRGARVEEFMDKKNIFERKPGVAGKLYELYDIKPQDIFIVISNSGINGIVIDIADLAKKNGHKVIIITSMKHTLAEASRHPSGKKLYEFGNVVIDNCGPHGDALLTTPGIGKVTAVSSICNNVVAQTMVLDVIEKLGGQGIEAPVLTGDKDHDDKLKEHYKGRI